MECLQGTYVVVSAEASQLCSGYSTMQSCSHYGLRLLQLLQKLWTLVSQGCAHVHDLPASQHIAAWLSVTHP